MESNCNNRNSMNYMHGNMRHYSGQSMTCNQGVHHYEHMTQQPRCKDGMGTNRNRECNPCKCEHSMIQPRGCETDRMQHTNREVEVECVCRVSHEKNCHRHDEMEQLGCEFPVVMSYVPWQQWGDLYEAECGLMQGTIFKDLNFIFCGERC